MSNGEGFMTPDGRITGEGIKALTVEVNAEYNRKQLLRESIALLVRAGGSTALTDVQAAEVSKTINELGQAEAALIKAKRTQDSLAETIAHRDVEISNLKEFIRRERRSLWDTFAAAGLGAGKDVDTAASQADQMMTRREGKW